jgi:hypothetical protein
MRTLLVLAHGPGGMFDLFPFLFFGGAIYVIWTALHDGQDKKPTTRTLPTSPFSRQVHAALRHQKPAEPSTTPPPERLPRRPGSRALQVVEGGEGEEGQRTRIPQRFEPAPPAARRKTS